MPDSQAEKQPEWAYIVGGYPQRFRAVELRLQKLHINVNGHCETPGAFQIPKSTTLILIITDQCSHSMSEKARAYAKQFKLPIIGGSYKNWCNMEARLESFGYGYRSLELVAGGEEIINVNGDSPQAKLGDLLTPEKKAELEKKVATPQPLIETKLNIGKVFKTKNPKLALKSQQMQEAIRTALDINKDRLTTYTNAELADDVSALLNYKVSVSGVGLWRKKWKIKVPPHGYKRPRRAIPKQHEQIIKSGMITTEKIATLESEVDAFQQRLNELVTKYNCSRLYILYEKGHWSADWEQVTVVSKKKSY